MSSPAMPSGDAAQAVRRPWCVWLAVGIVLLGAALNTIYLFHHCPIDLSEDEAHYWEWSRHLDYGYYSKPPGIAWVIWAAVKAGGALGLTGDGSGAALMPVVRMPAVLFSVLSGWLSLLLARRIFRADHAGLAAVLLSAAAPMFAVGSLLITIDSPMYLCWAGTVYCLWRAVEKDANRTVWLYAAGLCCAAGMLFKPVLIAIPICAAIAALADVGIRRALKTWHNLGALVLVALSQVPVVIWNAAHGWVMFRHIGAQGGLVAAAEPESGGYLARTATHLGTFLAGQAGGMGGILFVLLVIGVTVGIRKARKPGMLSGQMNTNGNSENVQAAEHGAQRTRWVFLLSFTVPLWAFYLMMNFWKATEPNWPAASYFTGIVLLAGVLVGGWNAPDAKSRRAWRTWGTVAVAWGILLTAAAMNMHRLYPLLADKLAPHKADGTYFNTWWHPRRWEPSLRLRGMQDRAATVDRVCMELARETGQDPLIITNRYDTSSSLAFYMRGQPFVYCIMSSVGGRQSQYDIWPGLNRRAPDGTYALAGRPAVIVGAYDATAMDHVLRKAFERIEGPERLPLTYEGVVLKELAVYRAYGFRGLPETARDSY